MYEARECYLDEEDPTKYVVLDVLCPEDSTHGHVHHGSNEIAVRRIAYLDDKFWERKSSKIYDRMGMIMRERKRKAT